MFSLSWFPVCDIINNAEFQSLLFTSKDTLPLHVLHKIAEPSLQQEAGRLLLLVLTVTKIQYAVTCIQMVI